MVDDNLELGWVVALTLVVLLVVVDKHLIGACRSRAVLPKDVLNWLASFCSNVGINIEFSTASRFFVAPVNSLTRGADDMEIEVVVVVPHQGDLDIGGLSPFPFQTGLKF